MTHHRLSGRGNKFMKVFKKDKKLQAAVCVFKDLHAYPDKIDTSTALYGAKDGSTIDEYLHKQ